MKSLKRNGSKSRTITALIFMFGSMVLTVAIISEPKFREPPNMVAFIIGFLSILSFFGFMFYALIYSFSDALSKYEFLAERLIIKKLFGKSKPESINYADIAEIKVRTPVWGNVPKEFYANFKIATADKTFELEAVNDWEEVLLYMADRVSSIKKVSMESLFTDELTALIYKQIVTRKTS